jgi:hypothetical protein
MVVKFVDMTRILYRLFMAAVAAALMSSCNSDQKILEQNIDEIAGIWHYTGDEAGQKVDVYLDFYPENTRFDLYQKIGEGAYKHYTGTFTMSLSKVVSGKYDSGIAWAREYAVSRSGNVLKLSSGEYSWDYTSVEVIPEDVKEHSVPTRSSEENATPIL